MEYHCEYCGFSGHQPASSCPVCQDGQADPWAIIRDIRSVLRLQGPAAAVTRMEDAPKVDRFAEEWSVLEISIRAIWSDLTTSELAAVQADRNALEGLLQRRYGYGTELASQLCTGVEELHERFNGQWDVVRECVPRHWNEINERDVKSMTGTLSELAGLLARRYGITTEAARSEIMEFLEKIDYPMLVKLFGTTASEVRESEGAKQPTIGRQLATN